MRTIKAHTFTKMAFGTTENQILREKVFERISQYLIRSRELGQLLIYNFHGNLIQSLTFHYSYPRVRKDYHYAIVLQLLEGPEEEKEVYSLYHFLLVTQMQKHLCSCTFHIPEKLLGSLVLVLVQYRL